MKKPAVIYRFINLYTLLFGLIFGFVLSIDLFGQNDPPAAAYCTTAPTDDFYISNPGDKTWTCNVPGVLVNLDDGRSRFSPGAVPGPYPRTITIRYQNPNYIGEPADVFGSGQTVFLEYSVVISEPPVVTFAPIADVCQTAGAFALAPRGNPVGGIFAGPGVVAGFFNPSVAGPGTHILTYTYPTTGCSGVAYQTVNVQAIPVVTMPPFADICIDAPAFALTTGSPVGGTYSGAGVAGGMFDPAVAGTGIHPITYTYTSGLCTNSVIQNIQVNALPAPAIGALKPQQCDTEPTYQITGFPTSASGSFTGHGITDNHDGTAQFDPGSSGLGLHNITYTYTDIHGCTSSNTQVTRVGTEIFINGLPSQFCSGDATVSFTYSPFSADPLNGVTGPGVNDLGGGNAEFDPSLATLGNNIITYVFWDDIGCENIITQSVFVYQTPNVVFSGLNASYCFGSGDVTLTGSYPGGTFSGPPGSIIDLGGGIATFKPSVLATGSYSITYTYTNASGCSASQTKNVDILPLPTAFNVTGGGSRCETGAGVSVGLSGSVTGINYKLYRDGLPVVPDNTLPGNTPNPINFGNQTVAGIYTVIATNAVTGCVNSMSANAVVSVTPQLAITTQPLNTTICEDGSASFTVEATGQNRHYQWYNDAVAIVGDNNVLILSAVQLIEDGSEIYCVVTSSCGGTITTNKAILTVNPGTKIINNPSNAIKCTGSSVSFSVVAEGLNRTYQWKKGAVDVSDVPGKTSGSTGPVLTITNLTGADAGLYSCEVSGDCGGSVTSTQATLTVNDPITIVTQPSSVTACTGTNTSFSVSVTPAVGLTYNWYFNNGGGDVLVGTGPSLAIGPVNAGHEGNYYCRITNACLETRTTNIVTLDVPASTLITINPVGDVVCSGSNLNMTVAATGENLSYQWFRDADPIPLADNAIIHNSSTANISFTGLSPAYSGNYRVKVTGTCGEQISTPDASLSVRQPIVITSQPVSRTICYGSDVTFSVTATGDDLSYQWQFNNADIGGATTSDYTISGVDAADAGNYRCVISSAECGSQISSAATLVVNPLTVITTHPVTPKNVCVGTNVSFSVTATGVGLTYQWFKDFVSLGAGYTSSTLNLNNVSEAEAGSYTCRVRGTCGIDQFSTAGVLTVETPLVITTHPLSSSVCLGSPLQLNVVTTGSAPSYQWYFDNMPIDNVWALIPGPAGTSQILDRGTFDAAEEGKYYCIITNGCGSVNSLAATIDLIDVFSVTTTLPPILDICENSSTVLTVAADQPVSYRWRKNGVVIPGQTSATLILNNIPFADNGAVYSCELFNSCDAEITSTTLNVSKPVSITQHPVSGIACPGSPFSLVTTASGTNPVYQWFETPAIPAGSGGALSFTPFAAGDAGTYYCVVSNICGSQTSSNAVITSGTPTSVTDPAPLSVCTGEDAVFSVTATGNNLIYEWRKNYIPLVDDGRIVGSGTSTLTLNNVVPGDEETYDVIVSGTCGAVVTSDGAFLTVTSTPSITVNPVPQRICYMGNASFSVSVAPTSDPAPTYRWYVDGIPVDAVANPSALTSTLNITGATTGGVYNCVVTNSVLGRCGFVTSTAAGLIVEGSLVINTQPDALQTKCVGGNITITTDIDGPTDMTLQWYKDDGAAGVPLANGGRFSGVDLPTLTINNLVETDEGSYFCRATSPLCGIRTTNNSSLVIQERLSFVQHPQSVSVCPGTPLTLNVVAAGDVTTYQWKRNGINVGTNSPIFTISPFVAATDAGNYTCDISNSCETITSDIAVVQEGITTSAVISGPVTACEGTSATFTVTASGNHLTYQWYHGAAMLSDNARIGGSTTSTLTISGLIGTDDGSYQCEVTGDCGFDNDNLAVLTVRRNIVMDVQPASTSVVVGTNATFTIVASGTITGYQWYKGAVALADVAGEISGSTTATLSVLNAQPVLDEGQYRCVVLGSCGNNTSSPATLTVIPASVITAQPATPVSVCEGATISLFITTSGAGHTYQWKHNSVDLINGGRISGATTSSLTISGALSGAAGDGGSYTCLVDGAETSSASVVTVNPPTAITTQPLGGTKCSGDLHIFSVSATGAGLTYLWYKNDLAHPILTATSSEYTINPVSTADNGTYFCVVTGSCGPQTSLPATLIVNNPVAITAQPVAPAPLCESASTSFKFDVTGGLNYLWKKNGQPITDANISGITDHTLVISNSVLTNSGVYSCTVTGSCGSPVTSNDVAVVVNPNTVITTQPIGRTTCEGDAVTFTLAATGTGLSYDWRRNGVSLGLPAPGNPALTISGLTKATHEGSYTCVVTGTCGGSITSDPAVLSVNRVTSIGAPVISANPICQNASTRINIAASGDGLTYLWKKNGQPITAANITGINTNELIISNAQVADAGNFTCTVTGLCGSQLTSTNAVIIVDPTTAITTQPLGYTKCAGDEVILNVIATGNITSYQWLKGGVPVVNGLQLSGATVFGATTAQLRITNLTATEAGSYTSSITALCGNVISEPAVLNVNVPVQITAEPAALTEICQGSSTSITVSISGTVTSFRWKKDGNYLANGGSYSGVNSDELVISNALLADAGFYSCEIVSDCNTINTQSAELRVNPLTTITLQPSNASLCVGENVQFMVTATGGEPLTYEWRFNNVAIPGASSNTYIINGINTLNAGAYTCFITSASGCGTATSNPANLTVNPGAVIVTQPLNTSVCEGSTAIISVAASGTAPLTYRWKYNNINIVEGGRFSGVTSNELRISGSLDADEGIYKCEVISPCGTIESSSVTLTVDRATSISIHPSNQNIVLGTTAVFSVSANGVVTGYQWQKDGMPLVDDGVKITGSTTEILRIANTAVSDAGSYRCVVTGKCGTMTSNPGILTVNVPVVISVSPVNQAACTGGSASFSVVASGSIVSYRWMFNGAPLTDGSGIDGSGTPNLVISSVTGANEGDYTCVVTGTFNTANSSIASLTVTEPVDVTVQPVTQALCLHDWLVLEVTASGEDLNYAWEKDGLPLVADANITGINSSLLVITDVTVARAGSYRCRVWNTCNAELSNAAVVTINPAMTLVTSPVNDTKCEGQNTTFSVVASGVDLDYQWYKGGVLLNNSARVTGATTGNLTISGVLISDQDSYSCTITDNCNTINSAAANLTVKERVVITRQPQNMTICESQNAFFEVLATGFNLTYQWQKDGVNISDGGNISGTSTSVLVINNVAFADRGVYRCLVTGDCNNILTNTANLAVNMLPAAAGAVSGSQLICQGAVRVLYVVPAIANATSYVWTLPHGAVIAGGAGTRSIEVDYPVGSVSGIVSVHGVNGCANGAESAALPVTVNPLPLAVAGPDQVLCTDATTLAADATGYIPGSGMWTKMSGQGAITSPSVPNSGITGISQGENIFRWTVTVAGCTSWDEVKITNRSVFVDAGPDQTVCSMSAVLAANTPSTGAGSWSIVTGGGLFSNMADPHSNVINLTRGANTFRWSINNGGCISSDEIIVRNDLPTNSDAGIDAILVVDNYILDANVPLIGTGHWSLISGSATITNPDLHNTTVTGLGIGDNIFRWTITNNLCYSQDEVKVTNFTPTVTDAGPDQTLCSDRALLNGTKPNYGTGQWSVVAGSGTFVDPYKWDTEVFNMGKGVNRYKWTVYEYMVTSDEVTITNNSPSSANAGIDQRLCVTNGTLAANNPMIGTGAWSVVGGSGAIANTALFNSAVSNLGSGANTFRWTVTNGGCSSYDEVNIINDQPTFAEAGGDQVICADSVNLYPNTPTIGTGEWSVVSGSAFFRGNKAYNLARGENRFAWTISNGTCSHTDIVSITSNKPTSAYTGEDKSICVDNITLPGNTPTYGTGVWSILSGSGNIENVNNATSPATNLAPGSNRFRWTITYNGCVSFDEVAISYDFIAANAGTDQVLCQPGAILNATDAGVGRGQWSVVGGSGSANFTNPNQSNTEVSGLDRGMNMLRWTVTNAGCVSSDDVIITNNSPSTAYAGSDRSVCGEEIFLNANTPLVGTAEWSILGGSAVIASPTLSNSKVSNLSIGRNVLRWTVTHLGCVSYDEVVINNDQPTNIEAGPSQYICADNTQLYATAPVVGYGRWSILNGSATFEDNTLYNTRITNIGKGENKLIWTVTSGGCSNFDSVSVVNNLPSAPNAGPDLDICADNVFMSANQPSIGIGRWSVVSGSSTFENPALPNSKATNLGSGPNVLRWTISNGSCIIFDEVTVLNSLPTVAYAGEDRSVCNTTANLLATNPVIGTGSWSVVSGSGILSDETTYNSQITNLGFGLNTLRWTTENGRCKTSDDVVITNNLAEVYAGPDQVVYKPSARLIGNKPLKGTGEWVVLAGNGVVTNISGFETTVTGLGGGANSFAWTINNEGCIASDQVVITHRLMPVADFEPLPAGGCPPLEVSFVNTSVGGAPYKWDFGDGTTSTSTNTNHTYHVAGNYKVRLTATGPDGYLVHKDTVINVRELPVARFEITPDTAFIPGNSISFFDLSSNADSLLWEFGDGNTSNEKNPSYKYEETGNYNVTLHVWSEYNCYDSEMVEDAVFIDLAGVINCPNAFTPNLNGPSGGNYNNNDFSNDVFHCYIDGAQTYHMEIYNRLGIRMFETNDVNIGWDGYFKGKLVEEGAYVFRVVGKFNNGQQFNYFGNILVIY